MNAPARVLSLRSTLSRLRFRSYLPLSTIPRRLAAGVSLSDQFLYRGDIAATRFVAENALALLLGRPVEVSHRLIFFDPQGSKLADRSVTTSRYFTTIPIEPLGVDHATFLHATTYPDGAVPGQEGWARSLQRLHRGYCFYQRTPDSVFAAVHGNFGGIVNNVERSPERHQLLARHRSRFLYTPQHRFASNDRIRLYIMNSCPTPETVEVIVPAAAGQGEPRLHASLTISPLGVRRCELSAVDGYLSFRSRLPMCRPLVFVENDQNRHHFDVFHT